MQDLKTKYLRGAIKNFETLRKKNRYLLLDLRGFDGFVQERYGGSLNRAEVEVNSFLGNERTGESHHEEEGDAKQQPTELRSYQGNRRVAFRVASEGDSESIGGFHAEKCEGFRKNENQQTDSD